MFLKMKSGNFYSQDLNHADNINEVSRDLYNVMGRRFSNLICL